MATPEAIPGGEKKGRERMDGREKQPGVQLKRTRARQKRLDQDFEPSLSVAAEKHGKPRSERYGREKSGVRS